MKELLPNDNFLTLVLVVHQCATIPAFALWLFNAGLSAKGHSSPGLVRAFFRPQ